MFKKNINYINKTYAIILARKIQKELKTKT